MRPMLLLLAALSLTGCVRKYNPRYVLVPAAKSYQQVDSPRTLARILEDRWSLARIEDFVKGSLPIEERGRAATKLDEDDWKGELHAGQTLFSRIAFIALVDEGKPKFFMVTVRKNKKAWLIEAAKISELFEYGAIELKR